MESSVIFLPNDVLIPNGKENKEASAICFEIRIPKKKNEELLRKVIFLWKKTKKKNGLLIFPNIITEQWGFCHKILPPDLKTFVYFFFTHPLPYTNGFHTNRYLIF